MNEEPKLKHSALLRNIAQYTSEDVSELNKLLLQPTNASQPLKTTYEELIMPSTSNSTNKPSKRKCDGIITSSMCNSTSKLLKEKYYEDVAMPSTSTCSTLPIKVGT